MTPLEQMPLNVAGRLLGDPNLAAVNILQEMKGVTDADLAQALSTVAIGGAGKKGAAIIVGEPFYDVPHEEAPGPQIMTEMIVRCIEKPQLNRSPLGTNLTAEWISLYVAMILHGFRMGDYGMTLVVKTGDPITYEGGEREYAVRLKALVALTPVLKPGTPGISGTAANVIIVAPIGTTVWYTSDGSYPYPTNPAAHELPGVLRDTGGNPLLSQAGQPLFSQNSSVVVPSGSTVRAVAYPASTQLAASDLAAATLT